MATKKTKTEDTKAKPVKAAKGEKANGKAKAAPKGRAAKAAKAAAKVVGGPLAKLKAAYGSKESLVGKIVEPLAGKDEDTDALKQRLLRASNRQLLRLAKVVETVTKKYGSREKLVAAIGAAMNKAKDADFLAKLEGFSLPRLFDLARSTERAAKA
jgi:hypothetical protein